MRAVHFGAGNIGRGFVAEVLTEAGFSITFVDINADVIQALNEDGAYEIMYAEQGRPNFRVENVDGLHSAEKPREVEQAVAEADIVTTAVGPNVLPHIAAHIAAGVELRLEQSRPPLDIVACENMVGGSEALKSHVQMHLNLENKAAAEQVIGFPNAAVDRIVPPQPEKKNVLDVLVEPFFEWVIETPDMKRKETSGTLPNVTYVAELLPFIQRKMFTVNTGHAALAYAGAYHGETTIMGALENSRSAAVFAGVLEETGTLLQHLYDFDHDELKTYHQKIRGRFQTPELNDQITRVGRQPMRKLGKEERLISPYVQLHEAGIEAPHLQRTIAYALLYNDAEDEESQLITERLHREPAFEVISAVTGLQDEVLLEKIQAEIEAL
ncbi:D-mannitol 1-phosphate 5-dehydrogenase [Salsuginibacillus halophilus]|uniref:Mannitol-1-phosphate 5-dehydrogenase n=1 Tax=Salsuginibacillus halophilus TaxID=517424 RepID=A0A2P8HI44_9BACI|nr:mannitol-1-phosphate 5-dehydrogenase [Salsuginibacillus halophilus]PSL45888.1 D-mannitol 1-phosphate 5-dehydrogenase [Salsuginibacillus halophilus]